MGVESKAEGLKFGTGSRAKRLDIGDEELFGVGDQDSGCGYLDWGRHGGWVWGAGGRGSGFGARVQS